MPEEKKKTNKKNLNQNKTPKTKLIEKPEKDPLQQTFQFPTRQRLVREEKSVG